MRKLILGIIFLTSSAFAENYFTINNPTDYSYHLTYGYFTSPAPDDIMILPHSQKKTNCYHKDDACQINFYSYQCGETSNNTPCLISYANLQENPLSIIGLKNYENISHAYSTYEGTIITFHE